MPANYLIKHKSVFIYGVSLAAAMFLMKWLEWRFLIINHVFEIYAGIIAIMFTALGIWLSITLSKPKIQVIRIENTVPEDRQKFVVQESVLRETGISARELEVLELMAGG
jgi:hypothetical protein